MARKIPGRNGGTLIVLEKGETANPNGRPRNLVKQIQQELELNFEIAANKSSVRALLGMLAYLPKAKLEELEANENLPISIRIFVGSILKDYKVSGTETIKGLISFEMGVKGDDLLPDATNLAALTQDQILMTIQHLIAMLEDLGLEKICEFLEEFVIKKRAGEAKIINQV